ncbi:tannase and feruloyl esterase [Durotheca rogersii]|uniref:tannase and feruloyl esterase n=1 Tax=Durotheca rogersii TaxID=419775 RepID=UPI00221EB95F|nr:tannase and feruloyl esterase [Durotheca rogersii]KAI5864199.1 tannase and feruloyl esterase [Durotheca rogersii]
MCTPCKIPYPTLAGAEFTSITAALVSNITVQVIEGLYPNHGAINREGVTFCHVTTSYTHTGRSDNVTVDVFLPVDWNGRLQAVGGGGWQAGGLDSPLSNFSMFGAVAEGYATATTNAGLTGETPEGWAFESPGKLNLGLFENFGTTSLNELSIVGKAVTKSYYGEPPKFSYFTGCSQGGRQGYKLAETYPDAFDGIAASAPALDFSGLGVGDLWPQTFMNTLGRYPWNCEIAANTDAAIAACDANDGRVDNVIADPDACVFDPFSLVGTSISCYDEHSPETVEISELAANVTNITWTGPRATDGSFLWWGLEKGTRLVEEMTALGLNPGLATTVCLADGTCSGNPFLVTILWIQYLVKKDPNFDVTTITTEEFEDVFRASRKEWAPVFDVEPNLDSFRDAGGKLISYHGLADITVPSDGTRSFFEQVAARDSTVHDYYRLFESPGLSHCLGGFGYYPAGTFDALVSWVENGVAPETLVGTSPPREDGNVETSVLCPYPKKTRYDGSESGICVD